MTETRVSDQPMIVDLLVNLETSDGDLVDPAELMKAAQGAGLDGLLVSRSGEFLPDIEAYRQAADELGLKVFSGAEIPTQHGLILAVFPPGFGLDDGFLTKEGDVYPAEAAIDAVERVGGATVALRPYDREVPHPMGDNLFSLQGLDACEVMNGRVTEIANDLALEAASNLEMPCVGSSSAQGTDGLGSAATLFRTAVQDEADLIALIKRGDCWPLAFSEELPREARAERAGRGRGRRDGSPSRDRGRGGRQPARDGGRRGSGPRDARNQERGSRAGGRRGRGRGRGERSGPTRVTAAPEHADRLPDDYGNRVQAADDAVDHPPDDIGNRLRPGESSPFREATKREDSEQS